MTSNTKFFKDRPVFGLDIGYGSVKALQIIPSTKKVSICGYGVQMFDPASINDGVITDIESVARAIHELFTSQLIGSIYTNRAVLSVPSAKSYNRTVRLPKLSNDELLNAVREEINQYVPVPIDDLYYDFEKLREIGGESEIIIVAAPKKIIDSYLQLGRILNIEIAGIETTIAASSRLFLQAEQSDVPTILIDFGSLSSDLTIFDDGLVVTGTVTSGGDNFTESIAHALSVTKQEAHVIKTKYGLGVSKKQKEITDGLTPILQQLTREIRRMIRYYEERSGSDHKISQIVTMGGGANMPGLSDYLTNQLRIPVRMCDPWHNLDFSHLQPPNSAEKSMYVTAAGLALTPPKGLFT